MSYERIIDRRSADISSGAGVNFQAELWLFRMVVSFLMRTWQ